MMIRVDEVVVVVHIIRRHHRRQRESVIVIIIIGRQGRLLPVPRRSLQYVSDGLQSVAERLLIHVLFFRRSGPVQVLFEALDHSRESAGRHART